MIGERSLSNDMATLTGKLGELADAHGVSTLSTLLEERSLSSEAPTLAVPLKTATQPVRSSCGTTFLGCVCSFVIGVSVFVATESIYIQDMLFTFCFDEGKQFAGYSGLFLFLPGLGVNLISPLCGKCRRQTGLRTSTLLCVVGCTLLTWGALVFFFLKEMMMGSDSSHVVAFGMEVVVGFCVSFVYASYTPLLSILQPKFYIAFTLGLYAPSTVVLLPAMFLAGDICLCEVITNSTTTRIVQHDNFTNFWCTDCVYTVDWYDLMLFYIPTAATQILGIIGFLVVSGLPEAKATLALVNNKSKCCRRDSAAKAKGQAGLNEYLLDDNVPIANRHSEEEGELVDVVGDLHGGGDGAPKKSKQGICFVLGRIKFQYLAIVISTFASQTLVALNAFLHNDAIEDLTTILMYLYYGCTAVGVLLTFIPAIVKLPAWSFAVASLLRLGYTGVIYMLVAFGSCGCSVYWIFSMHILSYVLGGLLFSASFPSAVQSFQTPSNQMQASNLLNIGYFLSICISAVPEVFLHDSSGATMGNDTEAQTCFT